MADFFFFTDYSSILGQDTGDNFGPQSNTTYRLDNKFNLVSNAKAYAICTSLLFAQFNTSGNLNLIFKPLIQPDLNVGRIAYIIYRNIKASSIINGNNIATRTNNDLTEKLWSTQEINDLNSQSEPTIPIINSIGLNYSSSGVENDLVVDSEEIDSIYYKTADIQFPIVNVGEYIGDFVGGAVKASIEVIVENIGQGITFDTVRNTEHLLQLSTPVGSTQYEMFQFSHKKESILSFLDITAFYGMFKYYPNNLETSSGDLTALPIEQLLTNFLNRNRIYLDVRNQYNRSFNYYETYGSTINLSFDIETSVENIPTYDYYSDNLSSATNWGNWPIFIIENQTPISLDEQSTFAKIVLKLPDINTITKHIYYQEAFKNNKPLDNKFLAYNDDILLYLSTWIYNENGSNKNGASYVLLKIVPDKKKDTSQGLFFPDKTTLSHIFPINRLKISESIQQNDVFVKSYYNSSIIERINYPDNFEELYASQIGIAKDANYIVFFSYPNNDLGYISSDRLQPNFTFASGRFKDAYDFHLLLTKMDSNLFFESFALEDDPTSFTLLALNKENDCLINKIVPDFLDTIIFTHEEYTDILELIDNSDLLPEFDIYLSYSKSDTTIQHFPGYILIKRILLIQGLAFIPDTNNTELQMKSITTSIIHQSLTSKN